MNRISSIVSIFVFFLLCILPLSVLAQSPPISIEPVAQSLSVPWSIVFTNDNRMLVSERRGTIVELKKTDSEWEKNDFTTLTDVEQKSEAGLMGLALHPNYATNQYVYAMYSYEDNDGLSARVVRFIDNGDTLSDMTTIMENVPCATNHCGGRIAFGPDKKLYIAIGDAREPKRAQDISTLEGKIVRIDDNGSIPDDNPFDNSPVYTLGHRNIQGLTWHPETGKLFSTEHGPSGIDGLGGGDEINIIKPGNNYGWPTISHRENRDSFTSPSYLFAPDGPPATAPASAHIVQNSLHPWYGDLLIGALFFGDIFHCEVENEEVTSCENLGLSVGRIRDIAESPNGDIFFSTSNQDGRATQSGKVLATTDDTIYQLHVSADGENLSTPLSSQNENTVSFRERIFQFLIYPFALFFGWLQKQ